jgi:hypothetical protein
MKEKYLKKFKGGSMAKTFLIEKEKELYVRKEIRDQSSLGIEKLKKQLDWILDLEKEVSCIFPKIKEFNFKDEFGYYDMEYYNFPSFKEYVIGKKNIDEPIKKIISKILYYCKKINEKRTVQKEKKDYIKNQHIEKMIERCKSVSIQNDAFNTFLKADKIIVNGKEYDNLQTILRKIENNEKIMKILEPKEWYRSHGDFTFQNVLTNGNDFVIIDPRGEGEDSLYYDLSKLFQSCNSKYDLCYEENFKCSFDEKKLTIDFSIFEHVDLFEEVFLFIKRQIPEVFNLEKNWDLITYFYEGSHMISMAPFRYKESLEFTLLTYGTGIKILNEFYEKIKLT